jgi:hypothetical protein
MQIQWTKGDKILHLLNHEVALPAPIFKLNELSDGKILVITFFDENTSNDDTNLFVYEPSGNMIKEIRIEENNCLVRFLGVEIDDGEIVILGANDFKYTLDPLTWVVTKVQYYR